MNTEVKGFSKNHSIAGVVMSNGNVETDELVIANGSWMPELANFGC